MKPLIGVTPAMSKDGKFYKVSKNNLTAIEKAGGIPLVLPYVADLATLDELAERIDGLYVTGGDDIDPSYFNEEPHPSLGAFNPDRDAFEIKLIQRMLQANKPVFGVCKGAQMLNLAVGGDMYQDIESQIEQELIQHFQRATNDTHIHEVELLDGSLIKRIANTEVIRVNSFHHQANRNPGKHLLISGRARDGVAEVIESSVHPFALGVQWHPEHLDDDVSHKLYREFLVACQKI